MTFSTEFGKDLINVAYYYYCYYFVVGSNIVESICPHLLGCRIKLVVPTGLIDSMFC